VAELRRLLIKTERLEANLGIDRCISLNPDEIHYLKRVLRLRSGDLISIVDGVGHIWEAMLHEENSLHLCSPIDCPADEQALSTPLICLAVTVPKRGFDEFLRMSCEIGVDIIQPLVSDRSVVRIEGDGRISRWEGIIREAVEQSERLWKPEIRSIVDVKNWLRDLPSKSACAFASPRLVRPIDSQLWMMKSKKEINQMWIAIGPEGGWTLKEQLLVKEFGCHEVQLGESILRTSTAAVVATQLMVDWRRNSSLCI